MNTPARTALDGVRYTLCGDPTADARVTQDLARIGAGVGAELGDTLKALVLVGPFARGEGSVAMRRDELQAVFQYPLIALLIRPHTDEGIFRELSRTWSELLDVDVDIRPMELARLKDAPPCLLWMDVARGHGKVVAGPPNVLDDLEPLEPGALPEVGVTRMLCDAVAKLAMARLDQPGASDNGIRCLHQLALALGDAHLLSSGHYPVTVRERANYLERVGVGESLNGAYRDALRFFSRPDLWAPPGRELEDWWDSSLQVLTGEHLTMEHRRVGSPRGPARFARWGGQVFRTQPAPTSRLRSALGWLGSIRPTRSPEERLIRAAVAMGYGAERPECKAGAAAALGTSADAPALRKAMSQAFEDAQAIRPESPITFQNY